MEFKRYLQYLILAAAGVMAASCALTHPASQGFASRQFQFNDSRNVLQDKIFYLLSAVERSPRISKEIGTNKILDSLSKHKEQEVSGAVESCRDMSCLADHLLIDGEAEKVICQQLAEHYHTSPAVKAFIKNDLRPSGFYALSQELSDSALWIQAWREQIAGLNYIIHAYWQNKGLQYAAIDSASFYVGSAAYLDSVRGVVTEVQRTDKGQSLFFKPLLDIQLAVLKLNGRDEAARFEPMHQTNAAAYKQFPATDWAQYPYSAILVFGEGPEKPGVAISEGNKERCASAAKIFKAAQAPFIIVSGGYVHPFRTPYCEAEQMKKYMTVNLGIPADKIIMEPHARHTTTNIRNANRIIYRNEMPAAKPVLGVSSPGHIKYIAAKSFERVCKRDLGYLPFEHMKPLTASTVQYYPSVLSLQINEKEPLDP